jgi:hypothetical membrane protein
VRATRAFLLCGTAAGPLFILVVLVQDYTRTGFDPRQHPLSLLAHGDWGWIQIANFVLAGLLNLGYAVGLRRALHPGRADTWGPVLIATYGLALITVGLFRTDPASGFPVGVSEPAHPSTAHLVHGIGAMVTFGSLTMACLVFARRFATRRGERGWAIYCAATGVAIVALFRSAGEDNNTLSLSLRAAVLVGWLWAAVIAARMAATTTGDPT